MVCFFFFQAEDGIRDLYVTGVQTCALPISGRERSVEDPVGEPADQAEEERRSREREGPRRALTIERAVDGHQQKRIRHGDGRLHPEAPDRLSRRERPGRGPRGGGQVREASAPQKEPGGEVALREVKRADRAGGHPRVPEEATRKVAVADEGGLAGSRRIREERVLGLQDALFCLTPGMVRAHELVRGKDAAAREERREEDEIESEQRGEADAAAGHSEALSEPA